jgi:uncharacterized protein YyaL (SSP411 family)
MLYDNAQLAALLVETYQVTREARFEETAKETLDYVLREMTSPGGGFYSATDADSEGEEGLFFVWEPAELDGALGPELAKVAIRFYGVTAHGNFEGKNILFRPEPEQTVANGLGLSLDALRSRIEEANAKLYEVRKKRIPPILDDKIITEWNAQMISAFARAGATFSEPKYVAAAENAAAFILAQMKSDGRLLRTHRDGEAKHRGVLEDHAFLVTALLDLYEATGSKRWLTSAFEIHAAMELSFADAKSGGYFGTPSDGETLLIREKPLYDGAQPSGNAHAALNLLRFAELTGDDAYRQKAVRTLAAFGKSLEEGALECPKLALALDFLHDEPKEIVVVTAAGDPGRALLEAIHGSFVPNRILITIDERDVEASAAMLPILENKRAIGGKATAYVCIGHACKKPTSDPAELRAQLAEVSKLGAPPLRVR